MHFTRNNQEALLTAALAPTDSTGWKRDAIAFGVSRDHDGEISAVVVFDNFTGTAADLHIAALDGFRQNREFMQTVAMLAFHERAMNRLKVWCQIAEDNREVLSAAVRVGFHFEYRKRGGFQGGRDAIVFSMERTGPRQAPAGQQQEINAAA
jgi:hypothetical protein